MRGFSYLQPSYVPIDKGSFPLNEHRKYMKLALRLAEKGLGFTSPNPAVGAVIVKNGNIVGRGYHKQAGLPHAEAEALREAGKSARGATMYVTLEPCNHTGRTPACTVALFKAGIKRLFYAVGDPNPKVRGNGAEYLRQQGISAQQGPCTEEARYLNRFYFHHLRTSRPYIIAKFAASLDGKIASAGGESQWITGERARKEAHKLRRYVDAVLIGAGTARKDNPSLSARLKGKVIKQPLRIVLDSRRSLPPHLSLFEPARAGQTVLVASEAMSSQRHRLLEARGTQIIITKQDERGLISLTDLLTRLGEMGVASLLVEGGSRALGSFVQEKLVDEVYAFIAPLLIGGESAPGAVGGLGFERLNEALRLQTMQIKRLGNDILLKGQITKEI